MIRVILTKNAHQTLNLGKAIGKHLKTGDIVALMGEIGSGKTVLVKGIAQGLKIKDYPDSVNSPSFVLIKEYRGKINLFHFDLYRLDNLQDIEELGWPEYLEKEGVLVIEWADKMGPLLPPDCLRMELEIIDETRRKIRLIAKGQSYRALMKELK